ncbi:SGNH/GDSL hydrolase family protein [Shimia thalassica]|uniref:SGNH/GDSL hydrolase family protein n=1 Tax=Shimia thalassica TaxID=1715693 RepID=UPI002493EEFF|nr:SGNH/GDSL hydrolase family protein [Shimia thalassica]
MPLEADQLLRIPLIPLLIGQAIYVRQSAMQLPEPPGPRQGKYGSGPRLRVLILGDSSAAGVGASVQRLALSGQLENRLSADNTIEWLLAAETGATTKTSLGKLDTLPPHRFDVAVLVHGVNDTTRLTSKHRFIARQTKLIDQLKHQHKIRHFVLSGVPPMHHFPLLPQPLRWVLGCQAQRLDKGLHDIAANRPDCSHVALDLPYEPKYVAKDGFHPSEEAYQVWSQLIADHLRPFREATAKA